MKKTILLSISILIAIFIATKLYFFSTEGIFASGYIAKIEFVVLVLTFLYSMYLYAKESSFNQKNSSLNISGLIRNRNILLLSMIIVTLLISFIFNVNKKSLDWDAVALYDSRAKILLSGVHFSEMTKLSEYDDKNKYYYLFYPPFTSIVHFVWYSSGVALPVGVIYSIFLLTLTLTLGLLIYERLGLSWTLLTVFLIISNENIFSISLIEYTNLPFTLFVSTGILCILAGLKKSEKYLELFGYILIAASTWIRYLEPVWACVIISMIIYRIYTKTFKKHIFILLIGLFVIFLQYLSWGYFEKMIAMSPTIFKLSPQIIFESFLGLFTGSFLNVFIYYLKSYGIVAVVYIASLIKINKNEAREYLFLRIFVLTCLVMYLTGIYGISFMFDWWREMSGSLVRSSSYLVPISILLIVSNIKYLLENNRSSGETIISKDIAEIFKNDEK
jgi:hypothetical protein